MINSRLLESPRLRRIFGLIRKETSQLIRDPSSMLVAGLLPLMLIFLFGYGVTFDPRFFTIGMVVEQPTPESSSLASSLSNSRYFKIETARDRRDFETRLVAGSIDGIIVVPGDFAARAFRGDTAPIQLIVDGGDPNTADLVRNYAQLLWANWVQQEAISRGISELPIAVSLEPRVWFNPELSSRNYLIPGSIAIILTMIGALLTALVVAREWERGTMEALLTTPVGKIDFLIGKLVPYFVLGMGSMILSTAAAIFLFDVPFRGSFTVLTLVSAMFMWAALGQGLLISTVARNQLVAAQVSILTAFLPAFYFSNFVFELGSMPWPLQVVGWLIPARYFVSSLQTLFLAGNSWSVILPDLLGLFALAISFSLLAYLTTRTRLA